MARNIKFIVIGCISAIFLLVIGLLAGVPALQPGILVVVKNSDPTPIVNVRVLIGGKALNLGTITPGRTARGLVKPTADSDVLILYVDAGGVQQSVRVDTYVTGGYRGRVDAEVHAGLLVTSLDRLY